MVDSSQHLQSIFFFFLLNLQAVLDDLAAVIYVEAADSHLVLFVADSFHDLVGDILDIAIRSMM